RRADTSAPPRPRSPRTPRRLRASPPPSRPRLRACRTSAGCLRSAPGPVRRFGTSCDALPLVFGALPGGALVLRHVIRDAVVNLRLEHLRPVRERVSRFVCGSELVREVTHQLGVFEEVRDPTLVFALR